MRIPDREQVGAAPVRISPGRLRVRQAAEVGGWGARVAEVDALAGLEALLDHHEVLVRGAEDDLPGPWGAPLGDVDERPAVPLEDRLQGKVGRVLALLHLDLHPRGHPRPQAGLRLVDLDRHPEELDPATLLLLLGERAYEGDRA